MARGHVEIRWLQDFLAVTENGNFTRVAAMRNTSQAAFSRRIQQLESWLGVASIKRSILRTQLTLDGEPFHTIPSRILADVLDARADLKGVPDIRTDHIRIALPFALAVARFHVWWSQWSRELRLTLTLTNVLKDELVPIGGPRWSLLKRMRPEHHIRGRPNAVPNKSGSGGR